MRMAVVAGIAALVLGAAGLWFGGISYTGREEVLELGPVQVSSRPERRIDIPPLLAGAVMAVGAGLVVYGTTRKG